ncbi:phosphoribosylglycinamide formyltransferase, partial [Burkholderia cenocepacia]|uniref:phosphoribosylglycinamide formyltransferase n=1 Tax=Burkholderia cenocepacia TaxID=95486 RepID=UPI00406CAFC8
MKNIVILISGRGSNMEAIVRACQAEGWSGRIAAVISNRPDAAGLKFAASHGIATAVVDHKAFPDRDSFDAALAQVIYGRPQDLVVMAGIMRSRTPGFVKRDAWRMRSIDPPLLSCLPGLDTHEAALAMGVKVHGATGHF